jgi:hypothetical protein
MAKALYCWRCRTEIPMLDEHEWEEIVPHLTRGLEQIKLHRAARGVSLTEAKDVVYGNGALERYFQLTGFRETNVNALWHHRLSLFGLPCSVCGKPIRTPRATMCAECGARTSESESGQHE